MLKRTLVALVAVMFMVGFTAPAFADEKKAGSEMKTGEKKDEKKKDEMKKDETKKKEEKK